jgi:hypothetical protein
MKKLHLIILMIIFCGCNKDITTLNDNIYGKWQSERFTYYDDDFWFQCIFTHDNIYYLQLTDQKISFKYPTDSFNIISDNIILNKQYFKDSTYFEKTDINKDNKINFLFSIKNNKMIWISKEDSLKIVWTKIK